MIKLIETYYRGYHFRSRLEARWAVLLDRLKVRWQYEPQGFDLNGTWYLPDFWIRLADERPYPEGLPPERGFWLEITPTPPNDIAMQKCAALSYGTGHCVYLAAGTIGPDKPLIWKWHPKNGLRAGGRRTSTYSGRFQYADILPAPRCLPG